MILKVVPKVGRIRDLKAYIFLSLKRTSWEKPKAGDHEPLPLEIEEKVLLREEVDIYVRHLPKVERLMFSAVFEHGMTAQQLSDCTGVSLRSTHRHIQQIKKSVIDGFTKDTVTY